MSVQLRNKSAEDVFVPDLSKNVEANQIVEVPGEVVAELPDCVVTKGPLGERAWPTSNWSLVRATKDKPVKSEE